MATGRVVTDRLTVADATPDELSWRRDWRDID